MEIVVVLAAVSLATFVVVCYLLFIWWLDRYEREPFWLVVLTFIWGAVGGTCLGVLFSVILAETVGLFVAADIVEIVGAVVIAPLTEEFTKGLIFLPLLLTKHIDNETDGLIYGAAAGLGFAALENLIYFVNAVEDGMAAFFTIVVIRTLFTALVHCISSAILGMSIGWVRHRSGAARWAIFPLLGFMLAVLNHAIWNALATFSQMTGFGDAQPLFVLLGMLLVIAASFMMFLLTQLSLKREHDFIRRYLRSEAEAGTIPMAHAEIIPYWTRRRRSDWLAPHIPKEPYIKAATLLAFRRHQLEIAGGERRASYLADIAALRQEVQRLAGAR
ncbi:MAG: PrsW family intramembrane metalloprotease [Bradymonadaceae bacterium]|nr:PrsW family intramembrane metalloprotease [Lujinxingiaceae bacterium]